MKNICFFGNFSAGGTERATLLVANELCKYENKYNIYILNKSNRELTFDANSNIKVSCLMEEQSKISKINSIYKVNRELYKYLKENNIDILISVEAMTGIYSIVPTKIKGCKHIIWEHANFFQKQGTRIIDIIRKIELKVCDYYIVLTRKDLINFKKNFTYKCKLDYIYNPIINQGYCDYNKSSNIILSAGHHLPIKNFNIIPDIGINIFDKYPEWKWEIYGECKGNEYERLDKKIREYGLENNIILKERNNNMESIYKKSAIYVLTSKMEGLPMVLLEAKTYNLPLVSFDIQTGPDEIFTDGVSGFLIEPYNINKMAEKICLLIKDNDMRFKMSKNAVEKMDNFNINDISDKWVKVIDSI